MSEAQERAGGVLNRSKKDDARSRIVLFVDDEPSLLEARRLMFEFMGYSVLTAESGEDGRRWHSDHDWDDHDHEHN